MHVVAHQGPIFSRSQTTSSTVQHSTVVREEHGRSLRGETDLPISSLRSHEPTLNSYITSREIRGLDLLAANPGGLISAAVIKEFRLYFLNPHVADVREHEIV